MDLGVWYEMLDRTIHNFFQIPFRHGTAGGYLLPRGRIFASPLEEDSHDRYQEEDKDTVDVDGA
jgi:hypothetical protein